MSAIELDALRVEAPTQSPSRVPRRVRGAFIRGPIPFDWIARASALPGHALHVALLVWFRVGIQGRGPVSLTTKLLSKFGVSRYAMYRALDALEAVGVVRVEKRQRGCAPVVDLCFAEIQDASPPELPPADGSNPTREEREMTDQIVLDLHHRIGPGFLPHLHLEVMRAAIALTTERDVVVAIETDGWWHQTPAVSPGAQLLAAIDEVIARVHDVRASAVVTRAIVSLARPELDPR